MHNKDIYSTPIYTYAISKEGYWQLAAIVINVNIICKKMCHFIILYFTYGLSSHSYLNVDKQLNFC